MSDTEDVTSREKTMQWLEDVLQTYYTYLEKKKRIQNGSGSTGTICPVHVSVEDFDIGPGLAGEGRMVTLSDLLAIHVQFKVEGGPEIKTEDLIVKIPPNDKSDREMAQMAQVDRREIHFYTQALPELEEWAESQKEEIRLGVPRVYFAKYHETQFNFGDETSNLSDAESVLVLEDLRPIGFSMRDFGSGLSVEETLAALREIATVHALSWAMQETTGKPLDDKWDFAYRPRKAASAYKMMIEQGFPTMVDFLDRQQPDGPELLVKLKALHPKAAELLCELLEPPPPPAPSCLTHMDFWCNNLLFRKRTPPDGSSDPDRDRDTVDTSNNVVDMECRIVDWQMMAISRPTHDVALLLFTSLTPEVREGNTDKFLQYYWSVFQETAKKLRVEIPFAFDLIEHEFKKSQLLALLLVIGSIDLALENPGTQHRLMQALRDMAKQDLI